MVGFGLTLFSLLIQPAPDALDSVEHCLADCGWLDWDGVSREMGITVLFTAGPQESGGGGRVEEDG